MIHEEDLQEYERNSLAHRNMNLAYIEEEIAKCDRSIQYAAEEFDPYAFVAAMVESVQSTSLFVIPHELRVDGLNNIVEALGDELVVGDTTNYAPNYDIPRNLEVDAQKLYFDVNKAIYLGTPMPSMPIHKFDLDTRHKGIVTEPMTVFFKEITRTHNVLDPGYNLMNYCAKHGVVYYTTDVSDSSPVARRYDPKELLRKPYYVGHVRYDELRAYVKDKIRFTAMVYTPFRMLPQSRLDFIREEDDGYHITYKHSYKAYQTYYPKDEFRSLGLRLKRLDTWTQEMKIRCLDLPDELMMYDMVSTEPAGLTNKKNFVLPAVDFISPMLMSVIKEPCEGSVDGRAALVTEKFSPPVEDVSEIKSRCKRAKEYVLRLRNYDIELRVQRVSVRITSLKFQARSADYDYVYTDGVIQHYVRFKGRYPTTSGYCSRLDRQVVRMDIVPDLSPGSVLMYRVDAPVFREYSNCYESFVPDVFVFNVVHARRLFPLDKRDVYPYTRDVILTFDDTSDINIETTGCTAWNDEVDEANGGGWDIYPPIMDPFLETKINDKMM